MSDRLDRPEPVARYSRVAMALHWIVAAFIFVNIFVGIAAANASDAKEELRGRQLTDLHKSVGLTILGLVVLRILWRYAHTPPPLPRSYSRAEQVGAHSVHYLLYAAMLLLPLTGYIHDSAFKLADKFPLMLYGLVHVPRLGFIKSLDPSTKEQVHSVFGAIHVYIGYVLYALLALHLLGVAKHHAVDREAELQRMLPETYRRPDAAE